jgi:hypothetical protein
MNDESPRWASWLVAGMAAICCAGPLLVAAVGAGAIAVLAASLVPYRAHLVVAAGVLLAVGLYTSRAAGTSRCAVNPAPLARPAARHLSLLFWAGAVLAVLAAFFSTVVGAK